MNCCKVEISYYLQLQRAGQNAGYGSEYRQLEAAYVCEIDGDLRRGHTYVGDYSPQKERQQ